ncbi:MAG TPA: hypothetical protein VN695_00915 [Streptosporangiaceae bacterium]|nr:hypothetical protein [Streptosporangiaceae bacterium]
MGNEVVELLNALHEGAMTVDEVAQRFRERVWPRRRSPSSASYLDALAAELQDPGTYIPGSFDDVIAAYDQRRISREQLRVLSEAVAVAQRAEDAAG